MFYVISPGECSSTFFLNLWFILFQHSSIETALCDFEAVTVLEVVIMLYVIYHGDCSTSFLFYVDRESSLSHWNCYVIFMLQVCLKLSYNCMWLPWRLLLYYFMSIVEVVCLNKIALWFLCLKCVWNCHVMWYILDYFSCWFCPRLQTYQLRCVCV